MSKSFDAINSVYASLRLLRCKLAGQGLIVIFVLLMPEPRRYDVNQLRDYSSLFTRSEFNRWYNKDMSSLKAKINRYESSFPTQGCTFLQYLKRVYCVLQRFYPNEYVYKNEFIRQWILQRFNVANSLVFSEFRVGKAVADLAVFNGISRVFEIKTLLDAPTRLRHQLDQYRKLFNETYLVVPVVKSELYLKRDSLTGVIGYDESGKCFTMLRKPVLNENVEADAIMEVLHTQEYLHIVEQYFGIPAHINDFNKFTVCKTLIKTLPQNLLCASFVKAMKLRRVKNEFCVKNAQFNQVFLSMNYGRNQKYQLLSNLNTSIV